ncbi:uncharacterized protein TNCV_4810131 [Trichonephila clavipes]|uniref:Uncharacterized protein n=1 Tax=Trichonephila clavipes TaxID=2585209 RepID=A0A8X6V970_TRICX|nr:uncharacterized protein TNCV_4810111 [Trichonephila clavipes]GFX99065.1 uncharacterized protein TNCV_4810131 [Trichonephila clavipes]
MPDFNAFYESFFSDRRQEQEPMDWEDVPFLPQVSAPFVPTRPPRKMRSLISVQVSEPPSLSANRFPNMRALVPKKDISYPTIIRSAIRPVPHGPDLPIPSPPDTLDIILDDLDQISHISSDSDDGYDPGTNDPELFSQSDLNDLVRDLGLPKDTVEVLGSRLKERHLLNSEPEEWRVFIDWSKRSLKAVLLHNGNRYASVPVGHSVHLKECYENLEFILNKLSYSDHKWTICGDLKVISMLLGQQSGYTKFPCFLWEWDSRDRKQHYVKQAWPIRKDLIPGVKNVERQSLVDPKKILFAPLHIKLGLMKQFVKALDKEGECFKYLCELCFGLSDV